MQIDEQVILRLEHLAKLDLTATERTIIKQDLEKIFEMFEKLKEVDTEGIDPFTHFNTISAYRADQVGETLSTKDAMLLAPSTKTPFFTVPKMID